MERILGYNLILLALGFSTGCAQLLKSRYAMDDPVYAEKYAEGASKTQPLKKLKQAVDARHVSGLGGKYYSGGAQWRGQETLAGAEYGFEYYPTSWFSSRMALAGYLGHGDWWAGVDSGMRIQMPTRITPFAGVGIFNGLSTARVDASDDGEDNDDDGIVDESTETETLPDGWLTAVYPELGIHFWPTGQSRLTGYARYLVSSEGRDHDDWLAGLQFTAFSR